MAEAPARNPALDNLCRLVGGRVGVPPSDVPDLAEAAGVDLWGGPAAAAEAITAYLDDIARNP